MNSLKRREKGNFFPGVSIYFQSVHRMFSIEYGKGFLLEEIVVYRLGFAYANLDN